MTQITLQTKLKKIAALASRLERHVQPIREREEYLHMTEKDSAVRALAEAVNELSPEVRELLEME